jgi:hypothetical protein
MIDDVKKEFKRVYGIYSANKDEMASMNEGLADQVKTLAKVMDVKPAILNKTFANIYKLENSGVNEAAEVNTLYEEMGNSAEITLND